MYFAPIAFVGFLASAAASDAAGAPLGRPPFGPDVSHYQGAVDWEKAAAAGIGFAMAKATEGTTFKDPDFDANWQGIRQSGVKVRGAYHFGRPADSASAQADFFIQTVGSLSKGDFLVLDIEVNDNQSPVVVAKFSQDFLAAVTNKTGLPKSRVLVYTGAWFWNSDSGAGGSTACGQHPLWVAAYDSDPPMPKGWKDWTLWQYTDKATDCGLASTDCSRYNGTQAELEAMMGI